VERSGNRRKISLQGRKYIKPGNLHQLLVSYRSGDMWAPQVEQIEALRAETAYFRNASREQNRLMTVLPDCGLFASWKLPINRCEIEGRR
jgi:hypothetical protein